MRPDTSLNRALTESVEQVLELIDMAAPVYNRVSDIATSSIGKHVRHILDHLLAYQKGVESGRLDYNLRNRETDIETEPSLAREYLSQFLEWLSGTSEQNLQLSVVTEVSTRAACNVELQSNSHREIVYLVNHAYHHIALATSVARSLDVATPDRLGLAPATATYLRQTSEVCAQ